MSCLSKEHRLNNKKDFNYLYNRGSKWHTDSFVAFYTPSSHLQLAVVSSKKVGNAVLRNKARRRVKALFLSYESRVKPGKYIFVCKDKIHQNNFNKLQNDFNFALRRLELLV